MTVNWLKLVAAIFVSQLAGGISSVITAQSVTTWYAGLQKPSFAPPNFVFAPVWTLLFLLMGIAAYLVWNQGIGKRQVRLGLAFFLFQLILNVLWSYLFFGLQNPTVALVEIVFLWLAILGTIITFAPVSTIASILLIPYLFWVTFAAILNFFIVQLN